MEDQLISFEAAKLAKEKGFDIHCRFHYDKENGNLYENEDFPYNSWNGSLFAPTQSLLQKWLREKHKLFVYVLDDDRINKYYWGVSNLFSSSENPDFNTYEEALEVGLQQALKFIK